jgi:hypothetical protein
MISVKFLVLFWGGGEKTTEMALDAVGAGEVKLSSSDYRLYRIIMDKI